MTHINYNLTRVVDELRPYHANSHHDSLNEFVREVTKAMGVEAGLSDDDIGGVVQLYYKGDEYTCGFVRITYGIENDMVEQTKYTVGSRNIENGRHNGRHECMQKSSQHMDTAIRTAKKFCTRLSDSEIRYITIDSLRDSMHRRRRELVERMTRAANKLGVKAPDGYHMKTVAPVFNELAHQFDSGAEFLTTEIASDVAQFVITTREYNEDERVRQNRTHKYVRVLQKSTGQTVHILPNPVEGEMYRVRPDNVGGMEMIHSNDVPKELIERLAVLSTLDKDTYLTGVGYKTKLDNVFFVED